MKGKFFVVGTPIGNLSDITFRAVEVLKSVAFILAEDTRHTKTLLNHYQIATQLVSYRDQNHERMLPKVVEKLDAGLDLALVSDAGMPLISDPGFKLIESLKQKDYEVLAVPGPDSVTSSLSVSGLPTDKFLFLGFLPKSDLKRSKILEEHMELDATLVIFESPNRLDSLLNEVRAIDSTRKVSVANDLTKMHEKVVTGIVAKMEKPFGETPKGEFVVLIAKK